MHYNFIILGNGKTKLGHFVASELGFKLIHVIASYNLVKAERDKVAFTE